MARTIPFGRDSWVAVNMYALRTDGRQTLTLDGEPPPDYTPEHTVAYLDRWEYGPAEMGLDGTFYCIKTNEPAPPDMVSALVDALSARGRGRWLRVVRHPVSEHTVMLWDADGCLLDDGPHLCVCGAGIRVDLSSVRCKAGYEILEVA